MTVFRLSRDGLAALSLLLCSGAGSQAWAQIGAFGGSSGADLTAPPVATSRGDPFASRDSDKGALPFGNWLLYPTAFAGAVYDSNVDQTSSGRSSFGMRFVPSLLAEDNDGINKTTIYGMADGRVYTNQGSNNADAVAARAGLSETYQPLNDLIFNVHADYTRQKDLFSTLGIDHSVTTANPTGIGLAPTTNPVAYNQFSGSAAVQKNFSDAFLSFQGSVVDVIYDQSSQASAPSPNGVVYTGTARAGYWIAPAFYGYVEGSLDSRNYSTRGLNSSGYRALGGIGSDRIGLFRFEVYGGYQAEDFQSHAVGTVGGVVLGTKGHYYPLPNLSFSLGIDETLGASLLAATSGTSSSSSSAGSATRVTSTIGEAAYTPVPELGLSARAGYIHTDYIHNPRVDDAWTAGGTVSYSVWRNWGVTFDYQHVGQTSNAVAQGFTRDVVTLGVSYKY